MNVFNHLRHLKIPIFSYSRLRAQLLMHKRGKCIDQVKDHVFGLSLRVRCSSREGQGLLTNCMT